MRNAPNDPILGVLKLESDHWGASAVLGFGCLQVRPQANYRNAKAASVTRADRGLVALPRGSVARF